MRLAPLVWAYIEMTTMRIISKGNSDRGLEVDLSTKLGQLELPAPSLSASGCAASGKELSQFMNLADIGAIVTKSILLEPRSGRATPRMAETPSGMLNSIGLQGPGIDQFIEDDLKWLEKNQVRTIVSIAGNNAEEFGRIAGKLRKVGENVVGIEVNISCPNVANRGLVFACQPESAHEVISIVRRTIGGSYPIFAKLSPDVTDIVSIAKAVVDAGASGVSVINTLLGMVIDTQLMKPALAGVTGGLSGPAIRPVAVRAVWQIRQAFPDLPIIGMGGILSGNDAFEFVLAGANAFAIGTANFHDPSSITRIQSELAQILFERGFSSLQEAVSFAHRN